MPHRLRTKAADLQVVFEYCVCIAQLMRRRRKKLPLIFETRSPGEYRSHIEGFAEDMADHIFREDAFGRTLIMFAAGSVNVMITRIPSEFCRIDPSFQSKCRCLWLPRDDSQRLLFGQIFRAACVLDDVVADRKF